MKLPKIKDLILFEDENLIVLNKPHSITSEGENAEGALSLSDLLKRQYPDAMLCHRLDRETSGVILAARNADYYRFFSMQFQRRQMRKEYRAIVMGAQRYENREINFPLTKKGNFKAVVDKREGKDAVTVVNSLEIFKNYTLVQALPLTGRFHQIRVHLTSIGAPLVGDALYGGKPFFLSSVKKRYNTGKYLEELPVMGRTALHAFSLKFMYPADQEFYIEAPYPKDFAVTVELLEKFDKLA